MTAYVESIAYVGERPWHGIGVELEEGATPEEMMIKAGLDWKVEKVAMRTTAGTPIPRHFALVRDKDGAVLSVVGKGYQPVQNRDVFDFFKRFCDAGKMTMETAGSLKDGRYVWALAKLAKGFTLGRSDRVESYLLLSSPYDPGLAMTAQFTPIRVVCWNTLTAALSQSLTDQTGKERMVFRMPHSRSFTSEIQDVAEQALGLAVTRQAEFRQAAELLVASPAAMEQVMAYWTSVLKIADAVEKAKVKGKEAKALIILRNAYEQGAGSQLNTARGTWWGAFNALTYVLDHNRGRLPDSHLYSAWFGDRSIIKRRALRDAVEFAKTV